MTAAKVVSFSDPRAEGVVPIPLRELRRASWNARKSFDPASIAELRASIQQHGIQVPLIVRPLESLTDILKHPEQAAASGRAYEIVAGHRRFEAALNGGTRTGEVPCIVRELTDNQAREIGLVDNLQREDVPALEEADAYAELKRRLGTPAAIAARVGKDVAYVARRLQLVSLAEQPRKALAERLITVDHALLLARLGGDEQDEALKYALDRNAGKKPVDVIVDEAIRERAETLGDRLGDYWEPVSVLNLKDHIETNVGRKLSRAPWALDDAELVPEAGACSACPHNSKANDLLFGDLQIDEATCENGGCFKGKTEAFVRIQMRTAAGTDAPVRLSWKGSSTKPRMAKDGTGVDPRAVLRRGQWVEVKAKSCGNARAGVTVDWDENGYSSEAAKRKPGMQLTVCVAEKCKTHPKDWEKAAKPGGPGSSGESWEKRQEREKQELAAFQKIEGPVRRALFDALIAKLPAAELKRAAVIAMNETYAIAAARGWTGQQGYHQKVEKLVADAKGAEIDRLLFEAVCGRELHAEGYERTKKDKGRGKLRELARLAGVDAAAIEKKAEAALKPAAAKAEPEAKAAGPAVKKSRLSPAAKKRIAEAQKKRWAAAAKKKAGRK